MHSMIEHMKDGLIHALRERGEEDLLPGLFVTKFEHKADRFEVTFSSGDYDFHCSTIDAECPMEISTVKALPKFMVAPGDSEENREEAFLNMVFNPVFEHYGFLDELPDHLTESDEYTLADLKEKFTTLAGSLHNAGYAYLKQVNKLNEKKDDDGESDSEG